MKKRILAALLALGCALLVFTGCGSKKDTTPKNYTQIIHDAREAEDNDYYMIFSPAEDGKFTAQYGYSASYPADDLNDEIQNMLLPLLDLPEDAPGSGTAAGGALACRDLRFSYEEGREVLHGVSMDFPQGAFTAIVGESGCGKSTVASVLTGRCRGYTGSAALSGGEISALSADSLLRTVTYVGFSSYLFRGTVAENLRMARPDADDASLWDVLERVRLAGFLRGERGLDTPLDAQGANLSGGQRQRLALARALLHDSPVYVFDEATSNIDVESENDIMAEIRALARRRTVIVITHRLANVTDADSIYVLEAGTVAGHGPHAALLAQGGLYKTLWDRQQELEHFGTEEVSA